MEPASLKSSRAASWLEHPAALCAFLALMTVMAYWPVLSHDFVNYDDPDYFTANQNVLEGLTPSGIVWAFTTGHAGNWHPLTWLSLMLDAALFGTGPTGPHATNLLLHCANTALVFLLLRNLAGTTWKSFFVAGLFALHPLHVESVAWVAERKDVLSAFFGLLAIGAYARAVSGGAMSVSGPGRAGRVAVVFLALSLMSKPMFVTMPFLLLLLDFWPLGRLRELGRPRELAPFIREKWPFFALSAASCVVTFIAQQRGGAVASLVKMPISLRVENAFVSYARYLEKTFWPFQLAIPYPHPGRWDTGVVVFSVALVIGLSAIAWLYGRRFPFVFAGWFWFVGTLIPVIGIVQVGNQSMADRYAYIPLIGLFVIAAWLPGALPGLGRLDRVLMPLLGAALLAACVLLTRIQAGYWQHSGALFAHAVHVTKDNFVAYNNLGTWFSKNNQPDKALECFRQSLSIRPDNPDALYNLGNIFTRAGDWDNAIDCYRRALDYAPAQADMLNNLGFALASKKRFAEAIEVFEAALRKDANSANTRNNMAAVYFQMGHFEEAVRQYEAAARLLPGDARIWSNLGDALVRANRPGQATQAYEQALKLSPGDPRLSGKLEALRAAPVR